MRRTLIGQKDVWIDEIDNSPRPDRPDSNPSLPTKVTQGLIDASK